MKVVEKLILYGADINKRDKVIRYQWPLLAAVTCSCVLQNGCTPLLTALLCHQQEVAELLLGNNANVNRADKVSCNK